MLEEIDGFKIGWIGRGDLQHVGERVRAGDIDGIGLNPYSGWDGAPAELDTLPSLGLRALAVPFGDRIGFCQSHLDDLRDLQFFWVGESKQRWRISLRDVRALRLQFDRNIVFPETPELTLLGAFRFDKRWTTAKMPETERLQRFEANQGNCTSLDAISRYHSLASVDIANLRKLESIGALSGLEGLRVLRIESCKSIKELARVVSSLAGLSVLHLIDCGQVDSLDFVRSLNVKEFLFGRTVVRDGDLSVLDDIETVSFDDQPHYNRRSDDMLPKSLR